jgi:hypothetical protein
MKRLIFISCACAVLAVPAVALARPFPPDSHYQGRVEGDPNTYFGFGTSGSKKRQKVRHLAVALPMSCYDGSQGIEQVWIHGHFDLLNLRVLIAHVSGHGQAVVAKHSNLIARGKAAMARRGGHLPRRLLHLKIFYAEAEVKTDECLGEAELYGTIRRHGKARGYLEMKTHSDAFGKCYSGGLKWRAHRGAHVDYPPA